MTKDEYYQCAMEAFRPAETLIRMVPSEKLDWRPRPKFMSLGQVICHLGEGIGKGLLVLETNSWPADVMDIAMKVEDLPTCGVAEALHKIEDDKKALRQALDALSEEDFTHKVVAVPWGMKSKMERMALSFLEHFTNHKMQLFLYLKLLDLPVNTATLYFG